MRSKLSYANVMASIAVFIALGGASYAALRLPKNSVGAKQLKKNAVTMAKIKKEAVTAAKVKKGTLTGTQINASTLGAVPTAETAESANSLSPSEPWHPVGAPGEPQFQHGWKDSTSDPVAFYKDHEGIVHLKGQAHSGEEGEPIFQLPPGYRPAANAVDEFLTPCSFCGSNPVTLMAVYGDRSNAEAAGAVLAGFPAVPVYSLDGIAFRAES